MPTNKLFDIESERVVLSVLLSNPSAIEQAAEVIEPLDFSKAHAPIYATILQQYQNGEVSDFVTVSSALEKAGKLEAVGGRPYLMRELSNMGARAANVRAYCQRVREAADRRKLLNDMRTAAAKIEDNGNDPSEVIEHLIGKWQRADILRVTPPVHKFERISEERFILDLPEVGISFDIDRLRRERNELIGELAVRCRLPGVQTYEGVLSIADLNLNSARARNERATLLSKRANVPELNWQQYLEEFVQRVLNEERNGQPAVDLREMQKPEGDDSIRIEGIKLPRRHPTILFGDGGAAKSYTGLYLVGRLVEQGYSVALFDWELAGEDHRDRLERLFGKAMPKIYYARCERPLVYEMDRLRRIVRDEKIGYSVFDSVAFACDGPPESAEVAGRYFRAARQIGGGSLHIAHITKADGGDQKPFGSVFWHNGARSTYFVKLADTSADGRTLHIGLFNRKSNLGGLYPPTGFKIAFTEDHTYFAKADPADTPDLAEKMTVRQRMTHLLQSGALPLDELAAEIDAEPDTVSRTIRRYKNTFTVIEGGKVALLQRVS